MYHFEEIEALETKKMGQGGIELNGWTSYVSKWRVQWIHVRVSPWGSMLWIRKERINKLAWARGCQSKCSGISNVRYYVLCSNQMDLISRSRYFPEEKYKMRFCKLNYRVSGEPGEEHSSRILHVNGVRELFKISPVTNLFCKVLCLDFSPLSIDTLKNNILTNGSQSVFATLIICERFWSSIQCEESRNP